MFLFTVIMLVVWVGLLLLIRYKVPAQLRSILMWNATGCLLLASQQFLAQIASQQHWTLRHSAALGVAGILLAVAGALCSGKAAVSAVSAWHRTCRQRA